jgi:hypothetical protein
LWFLQNKHIYLVFVSLKKKKIDQVYQTIFLGGRWTVNILSNVDPTKTLTQLYITLKTFLNKLKHKKNKKLKE